MKTKTILLAVAALGLAASTGFSQGSVNFAAPAGVFVTTNVAGVTGKATSALGPKIELLYQPDTGGSAPAGIGSFGSSLGNWEAMTPTTVPVGSPSAGTFGQTTETTGSDVTAPANVWLTAIGWTGTYTTYAAAVAANALGELYGVANTGVWSQATYTGTQTPVSTSGNWTGLVLTPTPEPATIALGGLGAAALLLFRRRK